ncbi:hypothetical protein J9253_06035 [Thiothrix litoralis]|uniref:Uncharacterized protein n=1 Tax=Thiothrix litoralis TaxID=2891210 RepID=A0ABX7WWU3_9GAMM|nr:hypothetical protein [Thiothrix litoralis]QTR47492.1 hypothetical protein J9253_06035 [Thiothrix litoralis]
MKTQNTMSLKSALTGAAATATALLLIINPAAAAAKFADNKLPVIIKTECSVFLNREHCIYTFEDGTTKTEIKPLGTRPENFPAPKKTAASDQACTVFFRATVGGQPAMRPTTIRVMQSGIVVMEIHGHSATTKELTCWGNYTAYFTTTIAEKEVTKTRTFTVLTTTKAIVAMD